MLVSSAQRRVRPSTWLLNLTITNAKATDKSTEQGSAGLIIQLVDLNISVLDRSYGGPVRWSCELIGRRTID